MINLLCVPLKHSLILMDEEEVGKWANFSTYGPQWLLKFDRGARPGADGVFWQPTSWEKKDNMRM